MAQRITTQLIDDLDQSEISEGNGGSVEFALRGTTYTIDLSAANIAKLEKAFAPFVKAAVAADTSATTRVTSARSGNSSVRTRRRGNRRNNQGG